MEMTGMTEPNVPTADELRARVRAAEQEAQAAQDRYEAFDVRDPSADSTPEYEEAHLQARQTWVKAEMARHDLDAFLNPKRYAKRGYQGEAGAGVIKTRLRKAITKRPKKANVATLAAQHRPHRPASGKATCSTPQHLRARPCRRARIRSRCLTRCRRKDTAND
jgi:hypothetical protein